MAKTEKIDELSFEEGIKRLENIVEAMEGGELPLENLMEKFEEGTRLAKVCQDQLAKAEVRIQQIEKTSTGDLKLKPFDAANGNQ
ncbi:MAG TPA: exodeoxyribonuclease VII small subunit [Candidatus Acidoferrum sp.]|nr:exodeoxyribonuclease VII small subunit [Candidatus Acidoferrum sp.]